MELKIYNPSEEDGFIKAIEWNYEELKAELSQKLEEVFPAHAGVILY